MKDDPVIFLIFFTFIPIVRIWPILCVKVSLVVAYLQASSSWALGSIFTHDLIKIYPRLCWRSPKKETLNFAKKNENQLKFKTETNERFFENPLSHNSSKNWSVKSLFLPNNSRYINESVFQIDKLLKKSLFVEN